MSSPQADQFPELSSYYAKVAEWVSTNLADDLQALKPLLTCFLTIKEFRDLLFSVNLATYINDQFINDIMLKDFGLVIVALRDYRGSKRRGVKEAYEIMNEAQKNLYTAYTAYLKKSPFQKQNAKIQALTACRGKLHEAYLQLEYLDRTIKK